jgi:hypothetical protein
MKKRFMLFLIVSIFITSISQTATAQSWVITGNGDATAASKLGTTNAIPLRFFTNNSERMRIDAAGNLGIGITTPLNILTVKSSGGTPAASWLNGLSNPIFMGFAEGVSSEFVLAAANALPVRRSVFQGRRSRGTLAAPLAVVNDDYLTSLLGSGYDGSAFQNPASIDIYVDGVPSAGHVPARISLVTGTNFSDRVERLKVGTSGNFNFNDNQLTLLQATGNVGIGTSTPAVKLDIPGTGAWDLASTEGDFRLGNATYRLKMGVANAGGGAGDAYIASANRLYLGAGTTLLRTQTVSINSNGRVGIGTYTPAARLQVVGDDVTTPVIQATATYSGSSDVRGILSVSKPADGYGYGIEARGGFRGGYFLGDGGAYTGGVIGVYGISSGTAGTRYGVYGSASGGTQNWGGYFPTKTYTSELRVGGTQGATGYVAAINGNLIATEVRVELIANWPDYVFKNGYKLTPLENLEAKINADKHLPGIPAEREVKKNGIMLGEMQTKTMEKVEENTLYIIQLNNKIKLLEKKIDELTKKKK